MDDDLLKLINKLGVGILNVLLLILGVLLFPYISWMSILVIILLGIWIYVLK